MRNSNRSKKQRNSLPGKRHSCLPGAHPQPSGPGDYALFQSDSVVPRISKLLLVGGRDEKAKGGAWVWLGLVRRIKRLVGREAGRLAHSRQVGSRQHQARMHAVEAIQVGGRAGGGHGSSKLPPFSGKEITHTHARQNARSTKGRGSPTLSINVRWGSGL